MMASLASQEQGKDAIDTAIFEYSKSVKIDPDSYRDVFRSHPLSLQPRGQRP